VTIVKTLIGVLLYGTLATTFAFAQNNCSAVDCDCSAINEPAWVAVCEARERVVVQECETNDGLPKSYCKLHGPEATPVATSVKATTLSANVLLKTRIERTDKLAMINTAQWSVRQDLSALNGAFESREWSRFVSLERLYKKQCASVFEQQRVLLASWAQVGSNSHARNRLPEFVGFWHSLSNDLDELSVRALDDFKGGDAKKLVKAQHKLARQAAVLLEYSGVLQAQVHEYSQAAKSWQKAAALAEQLVVRALSVSAPVKHVEYYRSQASARWHRAAYYWMLAKDIDGFQVAYQNGEQALVPGVFLV